MRLLRPNCLIFATFLLGISLPANAAGKATVQWHVKAAPGKAVRAGAKFTVTIRGQIDPGWHLYALEEPQGGPIATEIALTDGDPADLIRVEEGKPKMVVDPVFQKPTGFFEDSAEFTLHLQLAKDVKAGPNTLHILVRYQSCNDRVCLPPHTDTVPVELPPAR